MFLHDQELLNMVVHIWAFKLTEDLLHLERMS